MVILDVIPLILLPQNQPQIVSYFHTEALPRGTAVQVLFNNRKITAIVVGSDLIQNRKLMFKKQATFTLKNILKILPKTQRVTDIQLKIAEHIANYYFAPLGLCLKTVLSKTSKVPIDTEILHLFPEHIQAQYFQKQNPNATIGTRSALFVPFTNLKKIIIHDEANEFYKSDMTPKYHAVDLARKVAGLYGAEIEIINDTGHPLSKGIIADMIREIRDGNYSIFSRDLKEALFEAQEKKQLAILYIPRRGYANSIRCQTCGESVRCPNCSVSLVVHSNDLLCHHCNYSQLMPKRCPNCNSHTLKSHGIGINKVEAELKKLFSYQNLEVPPIFKLDSDTTGNNDKKETEIVSNFLEAKPSILLATQIIFSHKSILDKIHVIGIINADTLIHIPDFRAEERLFRQTYTLRQMANRLIVQTYNPEDFAIRTGAEGDVESFFAVELEHRKKLNYPPFSHLIKLTYKNRSSAASLRESRIVFEKLNQALTRQTPHSSDFTIVGPYPAFIERERGFSAFSILIKYSGADIQKRNELLQYVPSGWNIDVDPSIIV